MALDLLRRDLLQFLKHAVHASHPRRAASSQRPIYVLGNPSADLDSIISAILYSYFASSAQSCNRGRVYVPLVNLVDVRSGKELRRLRPEFAVALQLATAASSPRGEDKNHGSSMEDGVLLEESILTIADLKERFRSEGEVNRVPEADQSRASTVTESEDSLDVVMVDWNALPSEGPGKGKDSGVVRTEAYEGLSLTILGCIDHHDDEGFIPRRPTENPQHYEPRHIQTGVGSCTSLVVRELRSRGLWPDGDASETAHGQKSPSRSDKEDGSAAAESASHEAQAAKLALAAILIDTANMTAGSKVSDVDRAAVSFLEAKIRSGVALKTSSTAAVDNKLNGWDRETFYNEIQEAKSSSVENLTMDEVLGRDYKEWTESSQAGGRVKLGFCNVVKPLSWILKKANDSPSQSERRAFEPLFKHISAFSGSKDLDVVVLMTVFSGGGAASNDFHRELLVWDIRNDHRSELERFEAAGTKELGLESWSPEQEDGSSSTALPDVAGYCRVWKQTDVTKSRKQVAPLVRKALAGELSQ